MYFSVADPWDHRVGSIPGGGNTTVIPGHYSGGMSVGTHASVDLMPGLYYVTDGDLFDCLRARGLPVRLVAAPTVSRLSSRRQRGAVGMFRLRAGLGNIRAPNSGPFGPAFHPGPLGDTFWQERPG